MSLINGGHEDEKEEPRNIWVVNLQVRTASVTAHAALHNVTAFFHQASAGQLRSLQVTASKAQMDSLRRERERVCVCVCVSENHGIHPNDARVICASPPPLHGMVYLCNACNVKLSILLYCRKKEHCRFPKISCLCSGN